VSSFLTDAAGSAVVKHVWTLNKTVVIQGMVDLSGDKGMGRQGLARCFEVAHHLGLLLEILSLKHSWKFIINLALFAAQQNAIPFANWAAKNAEEGGSEFALAAVAMLRHRAYGTATEPDAVISSEYSGALMQALMSASFGPVATAEIQLLLQVCMCVSVSMD
jgi:hypothetical protein